jgi:hypothetical protein
MGLFRRNNSDIKNSNVPSSGKGPDRQERRPDQQKKQDDSDAVMEQWRDVPLSKHKSDGSGERG